MTLERWKYADPAMVAEMIEARGCHGCKHEIVVKLFSEKFVQCGKNRVHGKRCKQYAEGK